MAAGGVRVVLTFVLITCLAGARPAPGAAPATARSSAGDRSPRPTYRSEYDWYHRNVVEAYERFGRRNPMWDGVAKDLLAGYARANSQTFGPMGDENDVIYHTSLAAKGPKCDDPLVLHVTGRNMAVWKRDPAAIGAMARRAAEGMRSSEYHPLLQCYALMRAAEYRSKSKENIADALREARALMDEAVAKVPGVLDDPTAPRMAVFELMEEIADASLLVTNDRELYAARAVKVLDEKSSDRSLVLAVTAQFHVDHAWDARGGGFADGVSDAAFKLMAQRLEVAAAAGEAAFEIDPRNVLGPLTMLRIELGQGEGRGRMETWFKRAMTADPDCYSACAAKLLYLEPKWYGSVDDMLAFGRELLKQGNFDAGLPIILVDAHLAASRYTETGLQPKPQPAYFKDDPRVWEDVKAVYEAYFKRFPDALYHRSRYAELATWAGKWKEADTQFRTMGDQFSYTHFRNGTAYRRVRAEVEAKLAAGE